MQTSSQNRLGNDFFKRDALVVAPELLGKTIVRKLGNGTIFRLPVSEIEVYRGMEDQACHASKGLTRRNRVMFGPGGSVYMYLVYGMHWMFNIVTGGADQPEAILIRGVGDIYGPGRVTALLKMDGSFYEENITQSDRIWMENAHPVKEYTTGPRVGIHYAGEPWISIPWRYRILPPMPPCPQALKPPSP